MTKITVSLLRRRAEHNDGVLRTLEELTLHQFNIRKLECIQKHCRMLKILYLQNNKISVIENVNRLKRLQYLNLTLNCVRKVTGVRGCESLSKLDLTLNGIGVDNLCESLRELQHCAFLHTLHLSGNPSTKWPRCRQLVVGALSTLKWLDGVEISASERKHAAANLEANWKAAMQCSDERYCDAPWIEQRLADGSDEAEAGEKKRDAPETDALASARAKMNALAVQTSDGQLPAQRNVPRVKYAIDDSGDGIRVLLKTPRQLLTEHIAVDIHPLWFQCALRGERLLLHLSEEVLVCDSSVRRVRSTGHLQLTLPKAKRCAQRRKAKKKKLQTVDWEQMPELE